METALQVTLDAGPGYRDRVIVLGAGVLGLLTSLLLQRAGWRPLTARQRLNATLTALRAEVTLTAKERRTLRDDWLAAQPVAPQDCEAHLVPGGHFVAVEVAEQIITRLRERLDAPP